MGDLRSLISIESKISTARTCKQRRLRKLLTLYSEWSASNDYRDKVNYSVQPKNFILSILLKLSALWPFFLHALLAARGPISRPIEPIGPYSHGANIRVVQFSFVLNIRMERIAQSSIYNLGSFWPDKIFQSKLLLIESNTIYQRRIRIHENACAQSVLTVITRVDADPCTSKWLIQIFCCMYGVKNIHGLITSVDVWGRA